MSKKSKKIFILARDLILEQHSYSCYDYEINKKCDCDVWKDLKNLKLHLQSEMEKNND